MTAPFALKGSILVVDDDPLICEAVTMLLQCAGFRVASATSGVEALVLFEPGKFDVVFTDHFMPEMKGDELAAAIKERAPDQPVVLLTAYPEKLLAPGHPTFCVDSCISKPFEARTLCEAISKLAP